MCGSRSEWEMLWRTWESTTPGVAEGPNTRGEGQVTLALFASSSPSSTILRRPAKMSAVRHSDRRAARNQLSSPYKRPNAKPKKSVRSLFTILMLSIISHL